MDQALALASGGARGAYQAGALLSLAERGVQFDEIAGTSIGSLNGAFYAQGDGSAGHAEDLCALWRAMPDAGIIKISGAALARMAAVFFAGKLRPVAAMLTRLSAGPCAILDPRPVSDLLDRWIDYEALCSGRRRLLITMLRETDPMIDVASGPWRRATYFDAADLGPARLKPALLASAAIPLAFPSQKVEGKRYADAGMAVPLPAEELHRRGARRIVSIFLADDVVQNRADYEGARLLQIRPSQAIDEKLLSSIFDFSRSSIERLIDLGYRDARDTVRDAEDLRDRMVSLRERGEENVALADALPDRTRDR